MDIGLIGESKLPPFTIVLVQNVQFSPPECLKRLLQGNTATQSEPASLFCLLLTQTRRHSDEASLSWIRIHTYASFTKSDAICAPCCTVA